VEKWATMKLSKKNERTKHTQRKERKKEHTLYRNNEYSSISNEGNIQNKIWSILNLRGRLWRCVSKWNLIFLYKFCYWTQKNCVIFAIHTVIYHHVPYQKGTVASIRYAVEQFVFIFHNMQLHIINLLPIIPHLSRRFGVL
jgi:hypothetical protein